MQIPLKSLLIGLTFTLLFTAFLLQAKEQYPPLKANQWSYATDPYGSSAELRSQLITPEGMWINFNRIPRVNEQKNSWIEAIYSPEVSSLTKAKKINITYKCDTPLLIKLSQEHYGHNGDKSYAHYQVRLPKATKWTTREVDFTYFSRPHWTPANSKDYGIVLEKVNAIYLTPSMTDAKGGKATLEVKALQLLP
jgi:hypothetical protein